MRRQSARLNKGAPDTSPEQISPPPTNLEPSTRTRKRRQQESATRASKRLKHETVEYTPEQIERAVEAEVEVEVEAEAEAHIEPQEPAADAERAPTLPQEEVDAQSPEKDAGDVVQPSTESTNNHVLELDDASNIDLAAAAAHQALQAAADFGLDNGEQGGSIDSAAVNKTAHEGAFPVTSFSRSSGELAHTLRLYNLPIVGLLAGQIVVHLSRCSLEQILDLRNDFGTDHGAAWSTTKSMFNIANSLFTEGGSYIDVEKQNSLSPDHYPEIRRANIATAVNSILLNDRTDISELHDRFYDVFLRPGSQLETWHGEILIELKTQCYLFSVALGNPEEYSIERFFPAKLEDQLRSNHPELPNSPAELIFLRNTWSRRETLQNNPLADTNAKYTWEAFQSTVHTRLQDLVQSIFSDIPLALAKPVEVQQDHNAPTTNGDTSAVAGSDWLSSLQNFTEDDGFDSEAAVRRAALAAHAALSGQNNDGSSFPDPGANHDLSHSMSQLSHTQQPYLPQPNPFAPHTPVHGAHTFINSSNTSTQALYEKARLAATAKATSKARGTTGTPSQRRPWNAEEENALMAGLDMVKGPHWSQILAMFGAGGTVNEVLKDRNQVQLKDKARNLKLFFLKSGNEVPNYLQHVTGELKTRAPNQAAKHEARDRLRESTNEDRATMDAMNALAGTPRQRNHSESRGEGSSGDSRVSTPAIARRELDGHISEVTDGSRKPGPDDALALALSEAMHRPKQEPE